MQSLITAHTIVDAINIPTDLLPTGSHSLVWSRGNCTRLPRPSRIKFYPLRFSFFFFHLSITVSSIFHFYFPNSVFSLMHTFSVPFFIITSSSLSKKKIQKSFSQLFINYQLQKANIWCMRKQKVSNFQTIDSAHLRLWKFTYCDIFRIRRPFEEVIANITLTYLRLTDLEVVGYWWSTFALLYQWFYITTISHYICIW